jgi:transmembrane sensor
MSDLNYILSKHFAGESSPEDETAVQAWKVDHAKEYEMLKEAWASSGTVVYQEFDSHEAWNNIAPLLDDDSTSVVPIQRRSFLRYAVAASVIGLLGLTAWFGVEQGIFGNDETTISNFELAHKTVTLPDGSSVTLARNTTLSYHADFEENRQLTFEGRAFFDIERDEAHPFQISTAFGDVTVLGTEFDVATASTYTRVNVQEGTVRLQQDESSVILTAGLAAFASPNGVSNSMQHQVNVFSWRTGQFIFKDIPIAAAVDELNFYYGDIFSISDALLTSCRFNAQIDQHSAAEVAAMIELVCGTKVTVTADGYDIAD